MAYRIYDSLGKCLSCDLEFATEEEAWNWVEANEDVIFGFEDDEDDCRLDDIVVRETQ